MGVRAYRYFAISILVIVSLSSCREPASRFSGPPPKTDGPLTIKREPPPVEQTIFSAAPPQGLVVPEGYRLIVERGIDTQVGTLTKRDGGPLVEYSIGQWGQLVLDRLRADPSFAWVRTGYIDSLNYVMAASFEGRFEIGNGVIALHASRVQTTSDLVDVFMLAVTFDVEQGDSSYIDKAAIAREAKGRLNIPNSYFHTPVQGIHTPQGRFAKRHGPVIEYEIGRRRSDIVKHVSAPAAWMKTYQVRGRRVRIVATDAQHVVVDTGTANFVASNVKTLEDVADVLLIAFSFK